MRADTMLPYRTPATAEPVTSSFVEGVVKDVSSAGATFTVPSWDAGKHVFGPAPHPPGPAPTGGMRCLVVFPDGTVERPWLVGVWPA